MKCNGLIHGVRFSLANILGPSLKLFSVLFKFLIFFLLMRTFFAFFQFINQDQGYVKPASCLFSVSQVTSSVESTFKADAAFIEIEKKLRKVKNYILFVMKCGFKMFFCQHCPPSSYSSRFLLVFEELLIPVSLSILKLVFHRKLHVSNNRPFNVFNFMFIFFFKIHIKLVIYLFFVNDIFSIHGVT